MTEFELDGQGGAFLIGHPAETLTLCDAGLRCLDLVDCAALTSLNLTACRSDLHLTVRGCPNLKTVHVPSRGSAGATIHWDFDESMPEVWLQGRVLSLDACWAGGQFARSSPRARTFDNVYVGAWDDDAVFARHELIVLIGQSHGRETLRLAAGDWARELIVMDCGSLQAMQTGPYRHALTLSGTGNLERIDARGGVDRLRVSIAPSLQAIVGRGRRVVLERGSGEAGRMRR